MNERENENTSWTDVEFYDVASEVMYRFYHILFMEASHMFKRRENSLHLLMEHGKILEERMGLEILLLAIFFKLTSIQELKGFDSSMWGMWRKRKSK